MNAARTSVLTGLFLYLPCVLPCVGFMPPHLRGWWSGGSPWSLNKIILAGFLTWDSQWSCNNINNILWIGLYKPVLFLVCLIWHNLTIMAGIDIVCIVRLSRKICSLPNSNFWSAWGIPWISVFTCYPAILWFITSMNIISFPHFCKVFHIIYSSPRNCKITFIEGRDQQVYPSVLVIRMTKWWS